MMFSSLIAAALRGAFVSCLVFGSSVEAQPAKVRPRTIADISALLDQYSPVPSAIRQAQLKLAAPAISGATPQQLYRFHRERGDAAESLGLTSRATEEYRRSVDAAMSVSDGLLYTALMVYSVSLSAAGEMAEAVRTREAALRAADVATRTISAASGVAVLKVFVGDLGGARTQLPIMEAARVEVRNDPRLEPYWSRWSDFMIDYARASILWRERRFDEAEAAFRNALANVAADLAQARSRARVLARVMQVTPDEHWETISWWQDNIEWYYAQMLVERERLEEAEVHVRNLLRRTLERYGKHSPRTARMLVTFSDNLRRQGRYAESAHLAAVAARSLEQAGVPATSAFLALARSSHAAGLVLQQRFTEALGVYGALRGAVDADPLIRQTFGSGDFYWAYSLLRSGRVGEAAEMARMLVQRYGERFGESAHETALARGVWAMAMAASGNGAAASEFSRALSILGSAGQTDQERSAERELRTRWVLEGYLDFLGSNWERRRVPEVAAEAFRIADVARSRGVQRALTASAARAAAPDPALAALQRREQDLQNESKALYAYLFSQLNLPVEQQLAKVQADMRQRIGQITAERRKIFADIQRRFPEYADLIDPQPATLQAAMKALRAGESLISIYSTDSRTYVWTLDGRGGFAFHISPIASADIADRVARLRRALDPGDDVIPAFDFPLGHSLYRDLLAPSRHIWGEGAAAVVSASGALGQLPLAVLLTSGEVPRRAPGQRFAEYRQASWLGRILAFSYVPSVTSLTRLRALPPGPAERRPFMGFGDPDFGGRAAKVESRALRNLTIARVSESTAPEKTLDWTAYEQLSPLPDTRDELLAIAAALGADPAQDVITGRSANRKAVKEADLSQRRIVAFATHGLVPGDLPALDQPALALARMDDPAESPLLTLSDVLTLKLNADWVVLSACNTAAGDGQGAEAVSGLGRAFFYAGTRSLLVTHWPVETVSARLLTTRAFEAYSRENRMSRAVAVQAAMLAVMDSPSSGQDSYAHPLFWAPYALIGDGGR